MSLVLRTNHLALVLTFVIKQLHFYEGELMKNKTKNKVQYCAYATQDEGIWELCTDMIHMVCSCRHGRNNRGV